MECRAIPILPNYAQACGDVYISPLPRKRSLCHTLFAYRTLNDPVIILITLAVVVGSFCLLSGFILLCVVSKAWQDETSEAILLMDHCTALTQEHPYVYCIAAMQLWRGGTEGSCNCIGLGLSLNENLPEEGLR
ncbi:uncharacterized protein LOC6601555 isoform X3 [Drosophila persimilis]|uniref:uncharacterized protein LOC6601555 isoform X3 n=1 Tax=Drosophila persimilis TaxID=7234 RepID=UPI000F07679C|nr:uncharacterized protein LOC6601555 isoform X3 [Drosophila persimilis]